MATEPTHPAQTVEGLRLAEASQRRSNWQRWGPYLAERQWGTVREDYSADGECWAYLPHDHARSRAYRWGEDGLLGFTDREARLCFGLALWNGRDPILKERLFGLTGPEGNHGEDVKELYYYLDATPTCSWVEALYKYPQGEFPYDALVRENARRGRGQPEFELADTGLFDENRYFDVRVEYAKAAPDDLGIRVTVTNRGPEAARLHLLPTLWFRNSWDWGRSGESYWPKPHLRRQGPGTIVADHATLGEFRFDLEPDAAGRYPELLFTENATNAQRLWGTENAGPYVKDAFHDYVIHGRTTAVNPAWTGTKSAGHYVLDIPAGGATVLRFRLRETAAVPPTAPPPFGPECDALFALRRAEADAFYAALLPPDATPEEARVMRQAYAGLLQSKQFYHYVVREWLEGDPGRPTPAGTRAAVRNSEWPQLHSRDVISMPDKWEYPWFAAWDLAFHMIPFAEIDPAFAKEQLVLFLREWYMHPNGQLPAYEFNFSDVNPPVHAWACFRVYKMTGPRGGRDRLFLERVFQKLLINFTWWVNRKDPEGNNLFTGGFLGLDNIGVFDRSKPLPNGGTLTQADGTAWMAFYCSTMLSMALELASEDPAYEDVASKFFEHFTAIVDAMNHLGTSGLWDEADGFYYDQLRVDGQVLPLRIRSMVGLIPLFAVEILEEETIRRLPGFGKRLRWFLENRQDLGEHTTFMRGHRAGEPDGHRLLAIPSKERLARVLRYLLDEREFLSPHGIRSLSKYHETHPYVMTLDGGEARVGYVPGESDSGMFGGNSNWRGPVWFPVNYLLVESLERYHHFYGDNFVVECPVGSGTMMNLKQVADEIARRLASLFLPDGKGRRPCHGEDERYATDPHWKDLVLFYEYFHGDTGRGVGASHQTGWTALATRFIEAGIVARGRAGRSAPPEHDPDH